MKRETAHSLDFEVYMYKINFFIDLYCQLFPQKPQLKSYLKSYLIDSYRFFQKGMKTFVSDLMHFYPNT